MNETNASIEYTPSLLRLCEFYGKLHGWLALTICSCGIVLNLFNIFILHKTKVVSYTTNSILVLISFADSIMMIIYIPFCIHYYIVYSNLHAARPDPLRDTLFWTTYSIFNIFTSITLHSISIWLTVYLAIYRYLVLKKSIIGIRWNEKSFLLFKATSYFKPRSKNCIFFVIAYCVIICVPIYLFPSIKHEVYQNSTNYENFSDGESEILVYYIDQSDLNRATHNLVFKLGFYFQAFAAKLIPCVLLIIFMASIINLMFFIKHNKDKICSSSKVSQFFNYRVPNYFKKLNVN